MREPKPFWWTAVIISVWILIILLLLWWRFLVTPIASSEGLRFYVTPGMTAMRFAYQLKGQAPNTNVILLSWLMRFRGDDHRLKVGEYQFSPYSTPSDVLNQVRAGSNIYHNFTIINGWNMYDVMKALESDTDIQHTLQGQDFAQIAKAIGVKQNSPEGWLYPDTYFFRWDATDVSILKRAYDGMQKHLQTAWDKRAKNLPYRSPYQALIVASMVEKETADSREKSIIAAVILQRLKIWMHLQIDASVIYGLEPHFSGQLNKADLAIETPYNTYKNYGLPPTPIAMPGPNAIHAALHPADTDYLYYVAKGDGTHAFSKTLAEQNAAVKKYLVGR